MRRRWRRVCQLGTGAGLILAVLSAQAENWQKISEDAVQTSSVDRDSFRVDAGQIWFREKHVILNQQVDPGSLRRIREIQERRLVDCDKKRIATASRAVFGDDDALIFYSAFRPRQMAWMSAKLDQAAFDLVCAKPVPAARRD